MLHMISTLVRIKTRSCLTIYMTHPLVCNEVPQDANAMSAAPDSVHLPMCGDLTPDYKYRTHESVRT